MVCRASISIAQHQCNMCTQVRRRRAGSTRLPWQSWSSLYQLTGQVDPWDLTHQVASAQSWVLQVLKRLCLPSYLLMRSRC